MQLTERERNRVLCSDAAPGCSSGQESGSRCTGDQTARTSTSANFLSHFYQNWKIEMLRCGKMGPCFFARCVSCLSVCYLFISFASVFPFFLISTCAGHSPHTSIYWSVKSVDDTQNGIPSHFPLLSNETRMRLYPNPEFLYLHSGAGRYSVCIPEAEECCLLVSLV